jgi:uncharacterized RDD family membrane protein YckC
MRREDQFVEEVLVRVPFGPRREQIESDIRSHIAERVEHGMSVEEAIRQFGDPEVLAESYLMSIPLVSAPFMSRVAAKIVDAPTICVVAFLVMYIGWKGFGPHGASFLQQFTAGDKSPVFIALCAVAAVGIPGYFIAAEYLTDKTLGKQLLGLRVVRESGARIGLGQSFVRQIPMIGSFFLIDVLFALFTDKKQRAFEMISKTRVVQIEAGG